MTTQVQTRYFKKDEARETLEAVNGFKENTPITIRSYTYKTGSKYEGQWKGGMRHGKGTMVWPDGARYEGEW